MHLGFRKSRRIQNQPQEPTTLAKNFKTIQRLAVTIFHDARFIELPLALFDVVALVMLFLTARNANLQLAPGVLPVKRQRDYGIAFAVNAAIE